MDNTVPVEDLRAAGFADEVEKVATAVAEYLDKGVGSNVAIISEPFAGRDAIRQYVTSLLDEDATHVDLEPFPPQPAGSSGPSGESQRGQAATPQSDGSSDDAVGVDLIEESANALLKEKLGSDSDTNAVVVADCHHLFDRRIGGFNRLDKFLEHLALSDALVVTTWNRYAWSYLDAVRDVGDSFSVTIDIPPLDGDELRTIVEAHHEGGLPRVVDTGAAGRVKPLAFDRFPVSLPGGRTVQVPYPSFNMSWLTTVFIRDEKARLEAVVFERLRHVSHGNPEVARVTWEDSVRDGEIAPSDIQPPDVDQTLDDDAALLLWTIVVKESTSIERLQTVFEDHPVEATLHNLLARGFVSVSGDTVAVDPETLPAAVSALDRRRLLW